MWDSVGIQSALCEDYTWGSVRTQLVVCEDDTWDSVRTQSIVCEDYAWDSVKILSIAWKDNNCGSKISAIKIKWTIVIVCKGSVKNNNNLSKLLLFKLFS